MAGANASRQQMAKLGAAALGIGLVAGCSGDEADAQSFPEDGPGWLVIGAADEFTEADAADVPPGGVPLLVHDDGCALAGRGVHVESAHEDSRRESQALLEEMMDDDGAHLGEFAEADFIASAGIGEDDDVSLPFLVADAAGEGEGTRYAVRAGVRLDYDGEVTTDVLQIRMDCPGSIDAGVWDGAREMLRPRLATMGVSEDDPWGTLTEP